MTGSWERHVGRFKVDGLFFRKLAVGEGVNLFVGMVVLDVRRNDWRDEREYCAVHPQFRAIEPGEVVPEYVAVFNAGESTPTWIEDRRK